MTDIEFQSLIQLKKIFAKKDVILPFTGNCNTYDLKSLNFMSAFNLICKYCNIEAGDIQGVI